MGPIDDWGRGDRLYRLVGAWVGGDLTEIPPGRIVVGVQSPPDWALPFDCGGESNWGWAGGGH